MLFHLSEVEQLVRSDAMDHPEYFCFPINRNEEYSSFLIVTQKRTNTVLMMEERQWLTAIISYVAVCLENIHLVRKLTGKLLRLSAYVPDEQEANELNWFRKVTFELQELERKRIATDLHDTTMQDIYFLQKKLSDIFERLTINDEVQRRIDSMYEYMEIINMNLRQSFFELFPHLLIEIGLVRTMEKVVEKESIGSLFEIEYTWEGESYIENMDLETKRHVFRIFQELLNNAKKYSQATYVSFKIIGTPQCCRFFYRDDGVGFELKRAAAQEIVSSGMGLEHLKSRVHFLNGNIDINTAKGRGVTMDIWIPMKEGVEAV